jgi:hypothetical protein
MMVHFENLDSTAVCFKIPLYRYSFVKQALIGSVIMYNDEQTIDKGIFQQTYKHFRFISIFIFLI